MTRAEMVRRGISAAVLSAGAVAAWAVVPDLSADGATQAAVIAVVCGGVLMLTAAGQVVAAFKVGRAGRT